MPVTYTESAVHIFGLGDRNLAWEQPRIPHLVEEAMWSNISITLSGTKQPAITSVRKGILCATQ